MMTKAEPKWKKIARGMLGSPIPFWGKRPEDRIERPDPITRELVAGWDYLGAAVWLVFARLLLGAGVLAMLAPVIRWVFGSPDFLTVGLADPIGRGLAAVCLTTGRCDLPGLIAGTALAVPMLVVIAFMLTAAFHAPDYAADTELSNDDVIDSITGLDERIVRLRADLVLAGVLPLSPEEKAELDEVLGNGEKA